MTFPLIKKKTKSSFLLLLLGRLLCFNSLSAYRIVMNRSFSYFCCFFVFFWIWCNHTVSRSQTILAKLGFSSMSSLFFPYGHRECVPLTFRLACAGTVIWTRPSVSQENGGRWRQGSTTIFTILKSSQIVFPHRAVIIYDEHFPSFKRRKLYK